MLGSVCGVKQGLSVRVHMPWCVQQQLANLFAKLSAAGFSGAHNSFVLLSG
jgi:hypothetical protein